MKDIREIIIINDVEDEIKLGERSVEIDTKTQATEVREIVKALKDTMRDKELKHLAAPTIGIGRRIFCIDYSDLEIKTYINPIICQAKGIELSCETSISIPGKRFMRPRNNDIMVMYQTPTGKIENKELIGVAAIVFQQEVDALDGMLLSDIGVELPEDFESWPEDERMQFARDYLDSLDLLTKQVQKEIDEDEELKKIQDASEFMTQVYKGEVQLEKIEPQQ